MSSRKVIMIKNRQQQKNVQKVDDALDNLLTKEIYNPRYRFFKSLCHTQIYI